MTSYVITEGGEEMSSSKRRKESAEKPLFHSSKTTEGGNKRSRQTESSSLRRILQEKVKQSILMNVDDLLNPFFWVEFLVEFILCASVAMLIVWALTTLNEAKYKPSTTHFGIFAGFLNVALIEGYGPLCGSPMNPAGVWGFFVAGRISLVRAIMFMVAEIAGAATGGMIGISLTPDPQAQVAKPILPGPGISAGMGMAIEGILTFNLLVVSLSCTNQETKTSIIPSIPIALWISTAVLAAGTHTGGLQNPIVPFGPAVATRNFTMHFPVYWAGPFIGATVGAIFYTLVITAKKFLERHRISQQPEEEDDTSKKNCKPGTYYPDDGQIAIHL